MLASVIGSDEKIRLISDQVEAMIADEEEKKQYESQKRSERSERSKSSRKSTPKPERYDGEPIGSKRAIRAVFRHSH